MYSAGVHHLCWGTVVTCSLGTANEITECVQIVIEWVKVAKPIIELGFGLLGLGTVVSIGVLTWLLKKNRKDIEAHVANDVALRQAAKDAAEAREKAEENERRSEVNLRLALEQISRLSGPLDARSAEIAAENAHLNSKLELLRASSRGDGSEFWSRKVDPLKRLADYERGLRNSIPLMLFANQKGGVGKTTLSTNLAAYFASRGERTLIVDLDYQGSATSLLLAQAGQRPDEFPSMIDFLFTDKLNDLWDSVAIQTAADNLDYISCWYTFEKLERHLEYAWAAGDTTDDIRYRLARALLSRQVQDTYDRVVIDAPPRMTTGFINGLCASTHLFVPTVVDNVSAVAVGTFASQFKKLRDATNTVVDFSCVVGTMTAWSEIPQTALGIVSTINTNVRKALNTERDYFLRDATMRRTTRISYSTEDGIAYLSDSRTRSMFDAIGRAVAERAPLRRARNEGTTDGGLPEGTRPSAPGVANRA